MPNPTLTMTRRINAPVARVFEAWSNPDLVRRWMAPGDLNVADARLDFRVGGAYSILVRAPDGTEHQTSGIYLEIVPNELLVFTWQWRDSDMDTEVRVKFTEHEDNATELTLTHVGFATQDVADRHVNGWTGCLEKLPAAVA